MNCWLVSWASSLGAPESLILHMNSMLMKRWYQPGPYRSFEFVMQVDDSALDNSTVLEP